MHAIFNIEILTDGHTGYIHDLSPASSSSSRVTGSSSGSRDDSDCRFVSDGVQRIRKKFFLYKNRSTGRSSGIRSQLGLQRGKSHR